MMLVVTIYVKHSLIALTKFGQYLDHSVPILGDISSNYAYRAGGNTGPVYLFRPGSNMQIRN
jgi:hypothetical protein